MPLLRIHPTAMRNSTKHTSKGEANTSEKLPKNHLMPSSESSECTPAVIVAESIHETRINATSAMRRITPKTANLLFISNQIVDVEDVQLQGAHYQARGIDSAYKVGKEFTNKIVLPFLQTLHAKRHTTQTSNPDDAGSARRIRQSRNSLLTPAWPTVR